MKLSKLLVAVVAGITLSTTTAYSVGASAVPATVKQSQKHARKVLKLYIKAFKNHHDKKDAKAFYQGKRVLQQLPRDYTQVKIEKHVQPYLSKYRLLYQARKNKISIKNLQ